MARIALLVIVALVPRLAAGQSAPVAGGSGAESHTMVRAAGMPLNDATLAPGMLTVRVVEGAFTRDLAGQTVDVQVTGGKMERATTGADGRAQFAHLPIAAEVQASAVVGGERLESEKFVMPSDGGVRLLLIAGTDAAGASSAPGPADSSGFVPPSPPAVAPPIEPSSDPGPGVQAIRMALVVTTVLVFALFMLRRPQRRS